MYIAINDNIARHKTWSLDMVQKRRELIKYAYIDGTASYDYDDMMVECVDQALGINNNYSSNVNWTLMELNPFEIEMFKTLYPTEIIHGIKDNTPVGQMALF